LAHQVVKRLYGLTNKKDTIKQIAKKYSRHESFRQREDERREEMDAAKNGKLEDHHVISRSRNFPIGLFPFLRVNSEDPAKKVRVSHYFLSSKPSMLICIFRISFQNSKITFLAEDLV